MPENQFKNYAALLIVIMVVAGSLLWLRKDMVQERSIEIHGHRGCRGLMPENSIVGFIEAMELGVDYLEMDVVLNGDRRVIVSHEPWMSAKICRKAETASSIEDRSYNLYKMKQSEIEAFDCGSVTSEDFPDQLKMRVHKPLLEEVVEAVRAYEEGTETTFRYTIEIKYRDEWYDEFLPERSEFLTIFFNEIDALGISERMILQSFDLEILKLARSVRPDIKLGYIIENTGGIRRNVEQLGFMPDYYIPYYRVIDGTTIDYAENNGIKVVPWTVNETSEMKKLIDLGVDGIITDYPNQLSELISNL